MTCGHDDGTINIVLVLLLLLLLLLVTDWHGDTMAGPLIVASHSGIATSAQMRSPI